MTGRVGAGRWRGGRGGVVTGRLLRVVGRLLRVVGRLRVVGWVRGLCGRAEAKRSHGSLPQLLKRALPYHLPPLLIQCHLGAWGVGVILLTLACRVPAILGSVVLGRPHVGLRWPGAKGAVLGGPHAGHAIVLGSLTLRVPLQVCTSGASQMCA